MRSIPVAKVRRAFVEDQANCSLALVDHFAKGGLHLIGLDGATWSIRPTDPAAVERAIAQPDVTRRSGQPLVLVNEKYGLLGVAFGPTSPPSRLVVTAVVDLDDASIPTDGEQPGWRLFDLDAPEAG